MLRELPAHLLVAGEGELDIGIPTDLPSSILNPRTTLPAQLDAAEQENDTPTLILSALINPIRVNDSNETGDDFYVNMDEILQLADLIEPGNEEEMSPLCDSHRNTINLDFKHLVPAPQATDQATGLRASFLHALTTVKNHLNLWGTRTSSASSNASVGNVRERPETQQSISHNTLDIL